MELKEKQETLRAEEKAIQEEHTVMIGIEEKCRKLNQLMREHNRSADQPPSEFSKYLRFYTIYFYNF